MHTFKFFKTYLQAKVEGSKYNFATDVTSIRDKDLCLIGFALRCNNMDHDDGDDIYLYLSITGSWEYFSSCFDVHEFYGTNE